MKYSVYTLFSSELFSEGMCFGLLRALRQWRHPPYSLVRFSAPAVTALLIASLSLTTLLVCVDNEWPVIYMVPVPALIAADWLLFIVDATRLPPHPHRRRRRETVECDQNSREDRWCGRCCRQVHATARHCSVCERCVFRRDHHCFLLGACLSAGNNLAHFLAFCLHSCIGCCLSAAHLASHLSVNGVVLTSVFGTLLVMAPPFSLFAWAFGSVSLTVCVCSTLFYLSVTSAAGTAAVFVYYTRTIVSGRSWLNDGHVSSGTDSFRLVFGRWGLWHFVVPLRQKPYNSGRLKAVKVADVKNI